MNFFRIDHQHDERIFLEKKMTLNERQFNFWLNPNLEQLSNNSSYWKKAGLIRTINPIDPAYHIELNGHYYSMLSINISGSSTKNVLRGCIQSELKNFNIIQSQIEMVISGRFIFEAVSQRILPNAISPA